MIKLVGIYVCCEPYCNTEKSDLHCSELVLHFLTLRMLSKVTTVIDLITAANYFMDVQHKTLSIQLLSYNIHT
jgi:hypothetical protein